MLRDWESVTAISSAASSRLSSRSPSPTSWNAFDIISAAWESPEEEMTAACLYCSAWRVQQQQEGEGMLMFREAKNISNVCTFSTTNRARSASC